jgi:5-oxopent-3-ene-1,2,5-tricarboxylate decarboxylase/2-hydroxyhepta-2,4-diene-1,7-dioate isomerase
VESRRILLDSAATSVRREGDELVAPDGRRVAAEGAAHLPPVEPTKIICVHLNYGSRVKEFLATLPPAPTYFHKPISALNAHGGAVVRPPGCRYLNYEGEVAIVIGRECRHVAPGDAGSYIAGYTIANDFGLHDFRDTDAGSMLRVKGSDTLCPLGPGLVDDWDFHGKRIRTLVNGEVRQDGSTEEMVWDMHYLVADLARTITLVPGDVILSGTPAGSRPVEPGDVVEVDVEGLGTLRNVIVEGDAPIRDDVGAQPSASEEVVSTAFGGDWEFRGIRPPRRGERVESTAERWVRAISNHDLDAIADCFDPQYRDEAPARPGEAVQGREEVRRNFGVLLKTYPDLRAELLAQVADGDRLWIEWRMEGTHRGGGSRMAFAGVNIFGVKDGRFAWGRIYTELVRAAGGIQAQLGRMAGESSGS